MLAPDSKTAATTPLLGESAFTPISLVNSAMAAGSSATPAPLHQLHSWGEDPQQSSGNHTALLKPEQLLCSRFCSSKLTGPHLGQAADPSNAGQRDEARPVFVQLPRLHGQQRGRSRGGRHEQRATGSQQGVQVLANLSPGLSHRLVLHNQNPTCC